MTKTKHSLLMSAISLLLCFSMLIGTTFAWFTDTVTSSGNVIKSGTLDVTLEWMEGDKDPSDKDSANWKNAAKGAIFNSSLWEPGYTEVRHIKIENEGTLALKYALNIIPFDETGKAIYDFSLLEEDGVKLSDVIDVYYIDSDLKAIDERTDLPASAYLGTLTNVLTSLSATANGELKATENHTVTLALKMKESAGNEYQNKKIGTSFAIQLLATQLASEKDSIDIDYDINALYPATGYTAIVEGQSAYDVIIKNIYSNVKVGTAVVPKEAVADGVDTVRIECNETAYKADVVITDGYTTKALDISVEGLKDNNTSLIQVQLFVGKGFNPDTFKLYHYDEEIACSYDYQTGYVKFNTADFSPFTIVFDANSEYVPSTPETPDVPGDLPSDIPQAEVTRLSEHENVSIDWKGYGGIGPDLSVDPDPKLEAAFCFECLQKDEEVQNSPYRNWYCDFYVKLDRDLGENEILLGGSYGDFGWIGFHNGTLTVEANTEVPLLGSVASPWTYEAIASGVGTFLCGVGDVDDALAGATFTVMLRLTNPEDENEYYNVETVEYVFDYSDDVATTAEDIKTALAEGKEEIKIAGEITLTEGLSHNYDVTFVGVDDNAGISFNGHNITSNGNKITYKGLNLTTVSLPYDNGANGERYGWYGGIDYCRHSVANYEDCTITGVFTTYSPVVNATGSTFNYYVQDGEEFYNMFLYGEGVVNATGCTFMYGDRAIKVYSESAKTHELNLKDCKFVATEDCNINKPLINFDSTCFKSAKLTLDNVTVDEKLAGVQFHNGEGNAKITVNTVAYTAGELQDAINNGSGNITLGGDIDLSQGIVIP